MVHYDIVFIDTGPDGQFYLSLEYNIILITYLIGNVDTFFFNESTKPFFLTKVMPQFTTFLNIIIHTSFS